MRAYLLSDLRLRCQQRADLEKDPHIGDPTNGGTDAFEWNRLISEMYGEIYSIVEGTGLRYFESEQTISATGAASYAVPSDHLATIDVEWVLDSAGHRKRLRRLNVGERARWIGSTGDARVWELAGQSLFLYPVPSSGTYKHLYMPQAPDLSTASDSTSVDLVQADGEAFLMWGVAVKARAKGDGDAQLAMAERESARTRFQAWCAQRSFSETPRQSIDGGDAYTDWWNPASYRWNPP